MGPVPRENQTVGFQTSLFISRFWVWNLEAACPFTEGFFTYL